MTVQKAATHIARKAMDLDLVAGLVVHVEMTKEELCELMSNFIHVFSRSPISVAAAAIYLASQASEGKKSQKGKNSHPILYLIFQIKSSLTCVNSVVKKTLLFFLEIGDIAGVADVTIRQSYRLMFPRAGELFPPDFKFFIPIDKLPCS